MVAGMSEDQETVEIDYDCIRHETANAYLIAIVDDGDDSEEVWIPKSQIIALDDDAHVVEIPEWLADSKGLI